MSDSILFFPFDIAPLVVNCFWSGQILEVRLTVLQH